MSGLSRLALGTHWAAGGNADVVGGESFVTQNQGKSLTPQRSWREGLTSEQQSQAFADVTGEQPAQNQVAQTKKGVKRVLS